jgi:hypothetical protein
MAYRKRMSLTLFFIVAFISSSFYYYFFAIALYMETIDPKMADPIVLIANIMWLVI